MSIVLEINSDAGNPRNSEGSFIQLNDGRIMYVYSRFNGETGSSWDDDASADLAARFSDDGGRSWTLKDEIIWKNESKENIMSVSLLRLQSGNIALLFLKKESISDCRPVVTISGDEGKSWTEPVYCTATPGYYVVHNDRLTQDSNGRLLVPAGWHRNYEGNKLDDRSIVVFFVSCNEGKSWKELPGLIYPTDNNPKVNLQEPGIIELNDGRLWAWARTQAGSQYVSFSEDKGAYFSTARPSGFRAPCSPMSVKRNPFNNELVAVWNDIDPRWNIPRPSDGSWGRNPLVLAVSDDEGQNWKNFQIIESDQERGFCYTAMHFTRDALILAYCCGKGKNNKCLRDTRLRYISYNSSCL